MPRPLDPSDTFDVVLASDVGRSPKPAFVFRAATGREWRRMAVALDNRPADVGQGVDEVFEAIRVTLVGWKNIADRDGQAVAYEPANIDEVISFAEAVELLRGALNEGRLNPEDKKKSASSDSSAVESSAPPAQAPPAMTSPATPSQP